MAADGASAPWRRRVNAERTGPHPTFAVKGSRLERAGGDGLAPRRAG